MSNAFALSETLIRKEKKNVDRRIAALMTELNHETTLLPETPLRLLQRALKFYRGVKPVLGVLVKLPFMPPTWSAIIEGFMRALDALDTAEVIGKFKAGRDL